MGYSSLGEFLQQRLRLDEVPRVEALGEPAVDRSEERARLVAATLVTQQPREARRRAQLGRARLLRAGDVD